MAEEAVNSFARGMCGIVRIQEQDAAPHPTQDQGGGQPRRSAADYGDIERVLALAAPDWPRGTHRLLTASSETLLTPYLALASRARSEMNS